ncbi:hypothetical protein KUCAC02_000385 [Chaenocephalus aceratus]|uniref:Uncharacterized protein n=1 Tax=Chaenocephalus aceratus TaxID=36190 RepID=A0ACB9W6M9_CHAAC|nr:hypothetical protein KUCAC02_000385 [Chaenocephalus aceratus]
MRIQGQPEGARRRLDLNAAGDLRGVELVRGRAGYGFTITGQRAMSANCKGPLQLVVHVASRVMGNPILNDAKFGIAQKNGMFQKAAVLRTISYDSSNSSFNSCQAISPRQRPVSEPDMSQWSQQWNSLAAQEKEDMSRVADTDSVFTDTEENISDWSMLNMTLVVGYLSSTELILNTTGSEEDCLKAIRERIRLLGTEQNTHTLVMMKVMYDCIRLCDDTGAVFGSLSC